MKEHIVTSEQIASYFGVSQNYISDLVIKEGMPKLAYNKFDLVECFQWWVKYRENIYEKKIEEIKKNEDPQKEVHRKNAEMKELIIQEKKENLIKADEMRIAWLTEIKMIINQIDTLPGTLTPHLKDETEPEKIKKIITKEIDKIKNKVANSKVEIDDSE